MSLAQPLRDKIITSYNNCYLHQIGSENLQDFSQFVFQQYAYHYTKKYQWSPSAKEAEEMEQEDLQYLNNAVYFGFKNSNQELLGTIKATLKDESITFPFEQDFGISLESIIHQKQVSVDEIWHLGRFAIDSKKIRAQGLPIKAKELLKILLIYAFKVITRKPNGLMIAESDVLIYKLFHELGVNMQIVGNVKDFIGSPTYPVIVTGKDIEDWLAKNIL